MLLAIFTLGYSVRVFERPVCAWYRPKPLLCDNQEGRVDFNILTNALWFIIITMTVSKLVICVLVCGCVRESHGLTLGMHPPDCWLW